ncbi:LysM peptidoglycan-binding domain-containing protein [Salinispirillum marinum]|uniref:LysM peptidoglycan-binding domain-containing protein n=2 Tax=Saccharospirillaceae TaxID=255527 RepID=A0ABV8BD78_9GAMM
MASCLAGIAVADVTALREDVPERYVVQSGDTLWDIANRFLRSPWRWSDLWYQNPQIDNPHLIYPGDVIGLQWVDDSPRITTLARSPEADTVKLTPDMAEDGVVRLQPAVRFFPVDQAINAIPREYIQPFLSSNQIVDGTELAEAPYVISGEEGRIVLGGGDRFFARGDWSQEGVLYEVFRPGTTYRDPVTDAFLGIEAIALGQAEIETLQGDVARLYLINSRTNVRLGDRLLLSERQTNASRFIPSTPPEGLAGQIVDVADGLSMIGQFNVVLLNQGASAGMEPGQVFDIVRQGAVVEDPMTNEMIRLPEAQAGRLMVFRVFERMAYGLVLEATNTMAVGDRFQMPAIRNLP